MRSHSTATATRQMMDSTLANDHCAETLSVVRGAATGAVVAGRGTAAGAAAGTDASASRAAGWSLFASSISLTPPRLIRPGCATHQRDCTLPRDAMRRTRILSTIGPASADHATIGALLAAGSDAF